MILLMGNGEWWKCEQHAIYLLWFIHEQFNVSFQLSIDHSPFSVFIQSFFLILFASSAGGLRNCNAAAFASFTKFAAPFCEFLLRRNRTKRGGLCNYWWKCGQKTPASQIDFSLKTDFWTGNRIIQYKFSNRHSLFTIDHSPIHLAWLRPSQSHRFWWLIVCHYLLEYSFADYCC